MIPASAPVSDPSSATVLTASVSFSFPDSPSLSQTKSYSGASDRKVLKKPGLKKPTLGSPGSQEAVSSTAVSEAATRTIRTALVSESDNVVSFITTDQGSAPFEGNDSPGLATSKIVTNQQKITEHAVNVEKTSGLVQISLYPSAKDTVAATDIPISNGKVKRDLEPTMSNKTPLGLTESKSKKLKSNKRGLEKELEMARTKLTQRFKPPSKGGGGGVSIKSVVTVR
ncbi:hypothetical protein BGX28_009128 [Mortierella sp. GBA30]|nr:hypothetical protein BGX28_009128 [Mortierella sp. GBA30]